MTRNNIKDLFLKNSVTGVKTLNFLNSIKNEQNFKEVDKSLNKVMDCKFKADLANLVYSLYLKKIITIEQIETLIVKF